MILYLCRHAAAEEAIGAMRDEDRPLAPDGIDKFRRAARGFAALEPDVTHIVTSPLLRARQTAEILFDILAQDKHVSLDPTVLEALGPPGKLEVLLSKVQAIKGAKNVVAVGHEPTLSAWIGLLCFGERGRCSLKKGAMAAIELGERQRGELLWLLQPRQLRKLA